MQIKGSTYEYLALISISSPSDARRSPRKDTKEHMGPVWFAGSCEDAHKPHTQILEEGA
jgi:hypothetical protein